MIPLWIAWWVVGTLFLESDLILLEVFSMPARVVWFLAYEVDSHAKKINVYENGELNLAQTKTLNSWLEQGNVMADNMKLMFAQSADKINSPIFASSVMDDKEDVSHTVTGMRNRHIEEYGTLNEASAAKKPYIPNNINLKPNERQMPPSKATNGY